MKKNLKLRAENFKIKVGDVSYNKKKIKEIVKKANDDLVNILLFPELSLTGASLYHGFKNDDILNSSLDALDDLKKFSKDIDTLFSVGLPVKKGRKIIDMVFLIKNGDIIGGFFKDNFKDHEKYIFDIPEEEFISVKDDYIYIYNKSFVEIDGVKIALSIGENEEKIISDSQISKANNAIDIILNPSAKTRYIGSKKAIEDKIKFLSQDTIYLFSSTGLGESSTDFVYEGLNIIAQNGKIIKCDRDKKVDFVYPFEINEEIFSEGHHFENEADLENIDKYPYLLNEKKLYVEDTFDIVTRALIQRMEAISCKKVILGLSGGLDSTMALLFIVKAFEKMDLPKENILLYTMPAFGTSKRTKSNAFKLAEAFCLKLNEIVIKDAVNIHLKDIGHDGKTQDIAYENAQARERTQILFDIGNMENAIVIGTGDKSEISQGFATYNGDHMSSYAVNASLTKTELRYIVSYLVENTENQKLKEVLDDILKTPISPELKNENEDKISQKTEDIIGPYELIDFFVYEFLENSSVEEIYEKAKIAFKDDYDSKTIKKWLKSFYKRLTSSQFKRSVSVDGPALSKKSFSPRRGYLLPSDMSSEIFIERIEKLDE
ncbi:NAD(+) synthase [Anaerococcus rubeinfantis]|uniref:NAD(+) synthase n=1 Tax=Anaerococcus rubeinfantis TaxID=1720199 RepID=UPI00073E662E|nr:NAD(+) synthase [Anaerococcus rubeinfantis]